MVGLVIVIVLVFWAWHHKVQPYVFRYQNTFEVWLYGATLLLLTLAVIYDRLFSIMGEEVTTNYVLIRAVIEAAMFITIAGSLLIAAVYMLLEYWAMQDALRLFNPVELLTAADKKIDSKLKVRLPPSRPSNPLPESSRPGRAYPAPAPTETCASTAGLLLLPLRRLPRLPV